jgi:hypothetical protein
MDIETIKKILPSVNEGDIKITLIACGGDKNAAVATLLGSDEGTVLSDVISIIQCLCSLDCECRLRTYRHN